MSQAMQKSGSSGNSDCEKNTQREVDNRVHKMMFFYCLHVALHNRSSVYAYQENIKKHTSSLFRRKYEIFNINAFKVPLIYKANTYF